MAHFLARSRIASACRGQSWRRAGSKSAPFGQTTVWTSGSTKALSQRDRLVEVAVEEILAEAGEDGGSSDK